MSIWETTFDDAFWLTLAGALFGFGGVVLQAILKSRCKEFHCLGISCVRDPAPPGQEPDLELGQAPPAMSPPRKVTKNDNISKNEINGVRVP
jgi:hypothetical protein